MGRSSAEDGWGWLFALGVPVLPAQEGKNCARLRAPCVRQNWGDRANSHPQPLLIRLARLSRTKPRGCHGIRFIRRPYAVRGKGNVGAMATCRKGRSRVQRPAPPFLASQRRQDHFSASSRKWRPGASTTCAIAGIRRIGKSSACGRDRAAKKRPHAAPLGLSSAAAAKRQPFLVGEMSFLAPPIVVIDAAAKNDAFFGDDDEGAACGAEIAKSWRVLVD